MSALGTGGGISLTGPKGRPHAGGLAGQGPSVDVHSGRALSELVLPPPVSCPTRTPFPSASSLRSDNRPRLVDT